MVYTLHYQNDELLKKDFFNIRDAIMSTSDIIQLQLPILENKSKADFYKILLKLDGQFRSLTDTWNSSSLKLRIIQPNSEKSAPTFN